MFKNKYIPQFQPIVKHKWGREVYRNIIKKRLGPGVQTQLLEHDISQLHDNNYCIMTTSGTAALMVAIKSLNLKPGSTILFPAYTFLAGANAARFLGYKVKLVDINADTMCMDPNKIKITKNVSCLIFVNHNGYMGDDVEKVYNICKKADIPMIEDSAQSFGLFGAGMCGDIGIFSFSVPKIVHSAQGGAIITRHKYVAAKCREIIDHGGGWRKDRIHKKIGINLRFNDILASYLRAQIQDLKWLLKKRLQIQQWYCEHGIDLQTVDFHLGTSSWMCVYISGKAREIIEELRQNNVQAVQYYKPISENLPYKTKKKFPNAEFIAKHAIYLPSSLSLKKKDIKKICQIIKNIEKKGMLGE